jgi:hypothetical protein
MVALVPAQISKLRYRLPTAPLRRRSCHHSLPTIHHPTLFLPASPAPRNANISPFERFFSPLVYPERRLRSATQHSPTSHCPKSRFPRFHQLTNPSLPTIDLQPSRYQQLTNPSFRNPFVFSSIQNARGCGGAHFQFSISSPLRRHLPRPARGGKSHVLSSLPPLCPLFALFSALPSFVFNRLQPLFPKHPGWGVPSDQQAVRCPKRPSAIRNVDAARTSNYHCCKLKVPGPWMKPQN